MNLDTGDAAELAELLGLLRQWLDIDQTTLDASLEAFIGHPAYNTSSLRADLDRFIFLLGGNDGEPLFAPQPSP